MLTACGIETRALCHKGEADCLLQQCLPLAVLKRTIAQTEMIYNNVATVLTACGIETYLHG